MNDRDPLEHFDAFVAAVRARLEQGRAEYGDRSFGRPVHELVGEIRQELLDVCGWAYIALQRLDRIEQGQDGPDADGQRRKSAHLEGAAEPAAPFVTAYFGIPLTADQRAEVERLAEEQGCITRSLVERVRNKANSMFDTELGVP